MKRICVLLLVAFVWFPSLTSAQGTDPELKELVRKIGEHVIRLEEQNRATQQQLALIERQMDKRFEQVDKRFEDVDKRLEQIDRRLGLFGWAIGFLVTAIFGGVVYLIHAVSNIAVVEQKIETKLDRGELAMLKKTVQAIKELLESKGEKIIIEP